QDVEKNCSIALAAASRQLGRKPLLTAPGPGHVWRKTKPRSYCAAKTKWLRDFLKAKLPPCSENLMPQRSIKVTFLFGVFALSGAALAEKLQITEDSQLLERIRSRMADHRSRLRNYTCHVVINRLIRPGNFGQIAHQDQLELEVAFVGERELFARSGETRFAEQAVDHIVPAGLIDNDSFGSHNELIFFGDAATFLFLGSTKKDGHQAFRFNFQVPERSSRITITGPAKTNIAVPYKGSLWVDAETSDVVRLEWETQITQTFSNIRAIHKVVRYKAARIGDS